MSEPSERRRVPGRQAGCSGLGCVVIGGFTLTLLGAAIGGACSVRIPLTPATISVTGSLGRKDLTRPALPEYVRNTVGDNRNFVNQTQTLTIGPAEGIQVFVIGELPGAPPFDINLNLQRADPR